MVGDPAAPERHEDLPMTRFLSAKGRQHRAAFERIPVYVGAYPW